MHILVSLALAIPATMALLWLAWVCSRMVGETCSFFEAVQIRWRRGTVIYSLVCVMIAIVI